MTAVPTRDRIRDSAAELFRRQGYHATGVKQIVGGAGAPLASLYHFYPGGKEALGADVVRVSGSGYQALVEGVWDSAPNVVAGVHAIFDGAAAVLAATGYEGA
jgi:AcrR family transcriptional regulator